MELNVGSMYEELWEANSRLDMAREAADGPYADSARLFYIDGCGHAVLTYEFMVNLAEFIGDRKALDAGAGYGIMTDALIAGGVNCVGVDIDPPQAVRDEPPRNVKNMDGVEAVSLYKPDVLILAWPTAPEDDLHEWSARTLEAFEGEHVVVIGYHMYCGTHRFWTGLYANWEDQKIDLGYDDFLHDSVGILDGCAVFARKSEER